MRPRTLLGFFVALLVLALASYWTAENRQLLQEPFRITETVGVPLYAVLLVVLSLGFLPPATVLLVQTLRRDLAARRERRSTREEVSREERLRRALDLLADGLLGRAAEELRIVLQAKGDDFLTLVSLGTVLRDLGEVEEAIEFHQRAAATYPRSLWVLYELIADYERQGQTQVAAEIRSRILRDFDGRGLRVLRHLRRQALDRGDFVEATRFQDEIDARLAGGPDEKAPHRDKGLRLGLVYQRGVSLLEEDRPRDAAEIFQELLAGEPRFIPARIMLGEAWLLLDDEKAAVAEWKVGFAETGNAVFLRRVEDFYIEGGDPMAAIETLHELADLPGRDLLVRFFLGRLYYRLEMHDDAWRVLSPLEPRLEPSPTYHFLLGRIHERRGEMALAVCSFKKCLRNMDAAAAEYRCGDCGQSYGDWRGRCESCGAWNSVDLAFERERLDLAVLGVEPLHVWRTEGDSGPAHEMAARPDFALPEEISDVEDGS